MARSVRSTPATSGDGSQDPDANATTTATAHGGPSERRLRLRWWAHGALLLRTLSRRTWLIIGGTVVLVLATALVLLIAFPADRTPSDPASAAAPVPLAGPGVPEDTRIGVIVTLGTGAAEGSQWNTAAEGARVAQQRYLLGGTDVTLVTKDDHGTSQGATDAVNALLEEDVAGIIIASSGPHLSAALHAAADADVPVILPYEPVPADAVNVWSLAPTEAQTTVAVKDLIAEYKNPVLIAAGGTSTGQLEVRDRIGLSVADDPAALAADVAHRTGADSLAAGGYTGDVEDNVEPLAVAERNDVVIVRGHPVLQAAVVAALQQRGVTVPLVLTPDALSPAFSAALSERGGAPSTALVTVGGAWSDAEALTPTAQGRAMSAFLAATRQIADSPDVTNLLGDTPFADTGLHADARSHDAVIALVEAIRSAGTTAPHEVTAALHSLRLDSSAGITGPPLDFATPHAFTGNLSVMYATQQDLGLRPTSENEPGSLVWFAEPHDD